MNIYINNGADIHDVIIIGGSYAGLSAALALGRARCKVLIVDEGKPCNMQTPHSHNFLTQDGESPGHIARVAREQVLAYPTIEFRKDIVVKARKSSDRFIVETKTGAVYHSVTLLLATGVKDIFPPITGVRDCWGISVLHCPYCHGYEVRDTRLGVLGNGDAALEFIRLLRNWSKDLVLLTNGPTNLTDEASEYLSSNGIPVINKKIVEAVHKNGNLEKIIFEDSETISLKSVFTKLPFDHHTTIAKDIGCLFTETNHIQVDEFGKTNIDGLYAAGDCTVPFRSLSIAVAGGTKAGVSISKALIEETLKAPVR